MKRAAQRGLGAVAAVVVVVLLALLAAAVVRVSWSSQSAAAQSVQAARANQAARVGIEWGLYQLLRASWAGCSPARSQILDLRADTGMWVTVRCTATSSYREGTDSAGQALTVRVYQLDAMACNGASCPDNAAAARPQYVEHLRRATVSDCVTVSGSACP